MKMDHYNSFEGASANNGEVSKGTASIPGKDDDKKLFVGGLTRQTTESELREYFGKFGEIESVTVKIDLYTGQSRGFAFIVFADPQTIDKLLSAGDHFLNKRKVDPKRVSKKHGKIFVGGLTPEITDEDIKEFFSKYGKVVEVEAPFDYQKNRRKGYCFITFETKDAVYNLLKTPKQCIKGKEVDIKKVKVNDTPAVRPSFPVAGWAFGGYPGGYCYQDYNAYNDPSFDYSGYDYGYGYGVSSPQAAAYGIPAAGKPKGGNSGSGGVRQFQRHQPY